jgi:hypothetical protein
MSDNQYFTKVVYILWKTIFNKRQILPTFVFGFKQIYSSAFLRIIPFYVDIFQTDLNRSEKCLASKNDFRVLLLSKKGVGSFFV